MVGYELNYEEIRLKMIEHNKKIIMELKLTKHAQDLRNSSSGKPALKPSLAKPRTKRVKVESSEVRKSTRAKNPSPRYKEIGLESLDYLEKPKRTTSLRKDLQNRVYASKEARENAFQRAKNLHSSLEPEFPSFVKKMTQSHVTGGFWLGLRREFCLAHLPRHNEWIILVDQNGLKSETKFLADKNGLSAGWRGFAMNHGLVDGDALVFHRIEETKFKVYIIRAYGEANSDSGSIGKENYLEVNKKPEENVSEATKLRGSGKRKRGVQAGSRV